jgi:hypothetical protein
LQIFHYEDSAGLEVAQKSPEYSSEYNSLASEFSSWMKRGVLDFTWSAVYELLKSYRSESSNSEDQMDTRIENAPFLHLEAYRLTVEDSEKYNKWFIDYCSNIFIPLFVRQSGLKGYDYFEYLRISVFNLQVEYPTYLSAIYFDSISDFENFEKSKELEVCRKTLRDIFPHGLKYEWYIQYQLTQSWRK